MDSAYMGFYLLIALVYWFSWEREIQTTGQRKHSRLTLLIVGLVLPVVVTLILALVAVVGLTYCLVKFIERVRRDIFSYKLN